MWLLFYNVLFRKIQCSFSLYDTFWLANEDVHHVELFKDGTAGQEFGFGDYGNK